MIAVHRQPVTDASAWTGATIAQDPRWRFQVTDTVRTELLETMQGIRRSGLTLHELNRGNVRIGSQTAALLRSLVAELRSGCGFGVIRGFPVQELSVDEVRLLYFGLGHHMGTCVSQDPEAALIADVKEKGLVKTSLTRAYGSKHPTRLHVDLSDVVGLLGVRQAAAGATSLLASSTQVFNELLERRPDLLETAARGFYWDRFGEHKAWESATSGERIPLFSHAHGHVSNRYNHSWIMAASVRRGEPLTDAESELLQFMADTARANALSVTMHPGDAYFANNYVVLHGRDAYEEDGATPLEQRRLFLRLWLNIPDFRHFADEGLVRYGLTSHGNLGWTAKELARGQHNDPQGRRRYLEEA